MRKHRTQVISNIIIFVMLAGLAVVSFPLKSASVAKVNPNVIYAGDISSDKVSFMINVYWGTEYLDGMLDVLDEYGVHTTFFVGGTWVSQNTAMLKEIIARGHEVGNHGYHHKDHDKLSEDMNVKEIEMMHRLVSANADYEMRLFAPPSGAYSDTTVEVASRLGYKTIMWTRDTVDWRDKDSTIIYNRAIKNIKGGDLVLMHPTEKTLEALPKILAYVQNAGLVATTVSDNIFASV